jgi:hypothetical protein
MVVDEGSRHALYQRLEEVLGHEEAATLMEHLPPVGWADVATKRDLDVLGDRFRLELEATEHRLVGMLHRELAAQTRTFFLGMIGSVLSVGSLALAAVVLRS